MSSGLVPVYCFRDGSINSRSSFWATMATHAAPFGVGGVWGEGPRSIAGLAQLKDKATDEIHAADLRKRERLGRGRARGLLPGVEPTGAPAAGGGKVCSCLAAAAGRHRRQ